MNKKHHARWLLCAPEYFDVRYEINPWMSVQRAPDQKRAYLQWQALDGAFKKLGVMPEYVAPDHGWPDMVFTANAGLVRGTQCVLSKFRYSERAGEEALFESWFRAHGFTVHLLTSGCFEGEGDALFAGDTLFGGYGFRTDQSVYDEIKSILKLTTVVQLKLINSYFYHLDTCFCPITDDTALFYPGAFEGESVRLLEKHLNLISVCESDARRFACNSAVLGDAIIIPAGCEATERDLQSRGFVTHAVELDEFMKAGGAAKCLSLMI